MSTFQTASSQDAIRALTPEELDLVSGGEAARGGTTANNQPHPVVIGIIAILIGM